MTSSPDIPAHECMNRREYFAAHAPFDLEDAKKYAESKNDYNLNRTQLMQALGDLRFEYADMMIERRLK